MKIYIGARPPRAAFGQHKKLAGTLQSAASSDPKSDSFSPTLRAVKGGSKNWYRTRPTKN